MSLIALVADAVVSELNDAFSTHPDFPAVGAQRFYDPTIDLEKLDGKRIAVIPRELTTVRASRNDEDIEIAIDVAVQGRTKTQTENDTLVDLAEEFGRYFQNQSLNSDLGDQIAVWLSTEHDPIFAAPHLRQYGVLTSVVTLRFRIDQ